MSDLLSKNRAMIGLFLAIVAVLVAILLLERMQSINTPEAVVLDTFDDKEDESEKNKIKVDIQGEVRKPGVYEFLEGQIVDEAITAAGGLTKNADSNYVSQNINRAKKLEDEEKIYIPSYSETSGEQSMQNFEKTREAATGKINLNTATEEELDSLPGIGPSYAQKIIDGRPYSKVEDIKKVKGIGESTFEKIKDLITV